MARARSNCPERCWSQVPFGFGLVLWPGAVPSISSTASSAVAPCLQHCRQSDRHELLCLLADQSLQCTLSVKGEEYLQSPLHAPHPTPTHTENGRRELDKAPRWPKTPKGASHAVHFPKGHCTTQSLMRHQSMVGAGSLGREWTAMTRAYQSRFNGRPERAGQQFFERSLKLHPHFL